MTLANAIAKAKLAATLGNHNEGTEAFGWYLAQMLADAGVFRNCLTCGHWLGEQEQCGLYKSRPPANIIVTGCESHTDIEIPF